MMHIVKALWYCERSIHFVYLCFQCGGFVIIKNQNNPNYSHLFPTFCWFCSLQARSAKYNSEHILKFW